MDKIIIRDLSIRTLIGTKPHERRARQDVLLNIELRRDLRAAGRSDALTDTVDYETLKREIIELVEAAECFLIEALAEKVATVCLAAPGVESVRVTLDKPGALRFARSVAVDIERARE